ncbi:MAG TPA: hypothetical protein VG898_06230 [Solirubrobacterales bacterium]|nr:hypothetical protein [Solirubrobacterales bacterium]
MTDDSSDWDALVASAAHPIRIVALEAMRWIDEPFSAGDLSQMYGEPPSAEAIAYHLRVLTFGLPVLRLYGEERAQGATRKLYYFRNRTPASRRGKQAA